MAKGIRLRQEDQVAEWNGAGLQIRRIIEGIIASIDEASAEANTHPTPEALVEYIVGVMTLYDNMSSLIVPDEQFSLESFYFKLQKLRWAMPLQIPPMIYAQYFQAVKWFELQLKRNLQYKQLLYKVGIDKKTKIPQSIKDLIKYSSDKEVSHLMKEFPNLSEHIQKDPAPPKYSENFEELDIDESEPEPEDDELDDDEA